MMTTGWIEISDGIECQIQGSERLVQQPKPCQLVSGTISGVNSYNLLEIPCFLCSPFAEFEDYVRFYQQRIISSIYWSNFPDHDLPRECATKLASEFVNSVLLLTNAAHRCCSPFHFSTVYDLQISFRNVVRSEDAFHTAVMESFEETGPTTKPTSVLYVSELLRVKGGNEDSNEYSSEWSRSYHECCICIDEIDKPSSSLNLPCLHIFHENCILRWLEKNHFCPLCRFEMPAED